MRVLFVPMLEGGLAHLLPLLALNKMLNGTSAEAAFLVPRYQHEIIRQSGVQVLDVDHTGFRTELPTYKKFAPDVVVDDASLTTGAATTLARKPRVAIQRTGMFPGSVPRNSNHGHSMQIGPKELKEEWATLAHFGLPTPQKFSDLFKADFKIVPGIRSIEVLPPPLQADASYFFAGPLIMDDYLVGKFNTSRAHVNLSEARNFDLLQRFFDAHRERRVIYATFGTIARAGHTLFTCLQHLLDEGVAIVTSINVKGLSAAQQELYFWARYLPMSFVCSHVNLMIHHCGSGTYHYPIMSGVPGLTIGTRCYDRDDVAVRLEELGASVHIGAPEESEDFIEKFRQAIERYFGDGGEYIAEKKHNIAKLKEEIARTTAAFDFEKVLQRAVRR